MITTYDFNRGGTIGVGYLGVVFTSVLYGITSIQSFQYYRSPQAKTDHASIKYLVLTIWILDTLQEIFAVHVFYFYLVDNFENPMGILVTVWSLPAGILVKACISFFVKLFFLIYIWKLSGNVYVTTAGAIINLVRFVINLYYPIRLLCALNVEDIVMEVRLKAFGSSGLASEVACDLLISICLTYYLHRGGRSGLRRSGDVVSRFILLVVITGTLSTLATIADLVAYLVSPDTLYVMFFNLLIAKLDANALLTLLNSRQLIRDGSSPNVVYVNNEPKAISRGALSPSDSSKGSGAGSGQAGIGGDDSAETVCQFVIDKPSVV